MKLHVLYITIWSSGTRVETQDVVYSGVAMANRSSRHKSRKPPAGESLKGGLYSLTHTYTQTHKHAHTHSLTNTHSLTYAHMHTHTQTHTHRDTHAQTFTLHTTDVMEAD